MLLPRRAAAFWEGPKRLAGRNRESRRREAAGRRNYPEAVPEKMRGGNGRWIESSNWRSGRPEFLPEAYGAMGHEVALEGKTAAERDRRFILRPIGGDPSTRRPVDESVGERGTVRKSEAGACVVLRGEFREGGVVRMP